MVAVELVMGCTLERGNNAVPSKKKADLARHSKVRGQVGSPVNGPPDTNGLPFT
jgi:hypothetical protein